MQQVAFEIGLAALLGAQHQLAQGIQGRGQFVPVKPLADLLAQSIACGLLGFQYLQFSQQAQEDRFDMRRQLGTALFLAADVAGAVGGPFGLVRRRGENVFLGLRLDSERRGLIVNQRALLRRGRRL